MPLDELMEELEKLKQTACHFFTVDDLNHLYRGGRLSRGSAFFGTLVGIKPVMYLSAEGKLTPLAKVRGRRQAVEELCRLTKEYILDAEDQVIYIAHADCLADAQMLEQMVREQIKPRDVEIRYLTPIIGTHAGPGACGIAFFANEPFPGETE